MNESRVYIEAIFKEEIERYEILVNTKEGTKERKRAIESYLKCVSATYEYILHFKSNLMCAILCYYKNEDKNFDKDEFIRSFIKNKQETVKKGNFLKQLEQNDFFNNVELKNIKEILEGVEKEIRDKGRLTVIRKLRNLEAHSQLNIDMNDLKMIFNTENKISEIEILTIPHKSLEHIRSAILTMENEKDNIGIHILSKIFSKDEFVYYDDRQETIKIHNTWLFIKETRENTLKRDIYSFREIDPKNTTMSDSEIIYTNVLNKKRINDRKKYSGILNAIIKFDKISPFNFKRDNLYIIGEDKTLGFNIYMNDTLIKGIKNEYDLMCKLLNNESNQTQLLIFPLKKMSYQTIQVQLKELFNNHLKGKYRIDFLLRKKTEKGKVETITNRTAIFYIEKKNEGNIELDKPEHLGKGVQNETYLINLHVRNTGNVQKKIKVNFEIADIEHFKLEKISLKTKNQKKELDNDYLLEAYEEVCFQIEILPIRSEHSSYKLGEIKFFEGTSCIKTIPLDEIYIEKKYDPVEFYNRVVVVEEMEKFYKEDPENLSGIKTYWVKGEAGQGKSRLAKEIEKKAEENDCFCLTVDIEEESDLYAAIIKTINRKIDKHYPDSIRKFNIQLNEEYKPGIKKERIRNIFAIINEFRIHPNTPNKLILQIDNAHLLDAITLEIISEELSKQIEFSKDQLEVDQKNYLDKFSLVTYSRTLDGLGGIYNLEREEKISKSLNRRNDLKYLIDQRKLNEDRMKNIFGKISLENSNIFELKKITVDDDLENRDFDSEVDMIDDIIHEIFYPSHFNQEEEKILRDELSKKSETNTLILQLLLRELDQKRNLIFWNNEEKAWEVNWKEVYQNFKSTDSEDISKEGILKKVLTDLYPEEGLRERLISDSINEFKGTDSEIIMNLIGILDGVDEEELKKQGLNIDKCLDLKMIIKEESESVGEMKFQRKFRFRHQLFKDAWNNYYENELKPMMEKWNELREELEEDFENLNINKLLTDINEVAKIRRKAGSDSKRYLRKREILLNKKFSNIIKFSELLNDYLLPTYESEENIYRYNNLYFLFLNGFSRFKEIDITYGIRYVYHLYLYNNSDFLDEIKSYITLIVDNTEIDIAKFKPKFQENIEYLERYLISRLTEENKFSYAYYKVLYLLHTIYGVSYDDHKFKQTSIKIKKYLDLFNDNDEVIINDKAWLCLQAAEHYLRSLDNKKVTESINLCEFFISRLYDLKKAPFHLIMRFFYFKCLLADDQNNQKKYSDLSIKYGYLAIQKKENRNNYQVFCNFGLSFLQRCNLILLGVIQDSLRDTIAKARYYSEKAIELNKNLAIAKNQIAMTYLFEITSTLSDEKKYNKKILEKAFFFVNEALKENRVFYDAYMLRVFVNILLLSGFEIKNKEGKITTIINDIENLSHIDDNCVHKRIVLILYFTLFIPDLIEVNNFKEAKKALKKVEQLISLNQSLPIHHICHLYYDYIINGNELKENTILSYFNKLANEKYHESKFINFALNSFNLMFFDIAIDIATIFSKRKLFKDSLFILDTLTKIKGKSNLHGKFHNALLETDLAILFTKEKIIEEKIANEKHINKKSIKINTDYLNLCEINRLQADIFLILGYFNDSITKYLEALGNYKHSLEENPQEIMINKTIAEISEKIGGILKKFGDNSISNSFYRFSLVYYNKLPDITINENEIITKMFHVLCDIHSINPMKIKNGIELIKEEKSIDSRVIGFTEHLHRNIDTLEKEFIEIISEIKNSNEVIILHLIGIFGVIKDEELLNYNLPINENMSIMNTIEIVSVNSNQNTKVKGYRFKNISLQSEYQDILYNEFVQRLDNSESIEIIENLKQILLTEFNENSTPISRSIKIIKYLSLFEENKNILEKYIIDFISSGFKNWEKWIEFENFRNAIEIMVSEIIPLIEYENLSHSSLGKLHYIYGKVLNHSKRFGKAKKSFEKAALYLKKQNSVLSTEQKQILTDSYHELIDHHLTFSEILISLKKYNKAEEHFINSIDYAKKNIIFNCHDFSSCLIMGDTYRKIGLYYSYPKNIEYLKKAEEVYTKALKIEENEAICLKLGALFERKGDIFHEKNNLITATKCYLEAKKFISKSLIMNDGNRDYIEAISNLDKMLEKISNRV